MILTCVTVSPPGTNQHARTCLRTDCGNGCAWVSPCAIGDTPGLTCLTFEAINLSDIWVEHLSYGQMYDK